MKRIAAFLLFMSISLLCVHAQKADTVACGLADKGWWFELLRYTGEHKRELSADVKSSVNERLDDVFRRNLKWKNMKHRVVIPFRLDSVGYAADRSVAIMLPAAVNGKAADFMLDTGAGINVVSPAMAARLHLRISSDKAMIEGNGVTSGSRAIADTLRIGNLTLRNVEFYVAEMLSGDDSIDAYLHHLEAIIGLPLIERLQACEIDFTTHEIISLTKDDTRRNGRGEAPNLCFQPGSDILTMEAWHTGEPLHVIPDTGASHSTLGNHYLHHHASTMVVDGIDSVRYAGYGGVVVGTEYRLPDFEITVGHRYISLPQITVFDGTYDQRLGMDYFSRLDRMIIDLRRMQIRVM